jgi:hypothetical protein
MCQAISVRLRYGLSIGAVRVGHVIWRPKILTCLWPLQWQDAETFRRNKQDYELRIEAECLRTPGFPTVSIWLAHRCQRKSLRMGTTSPGNLTHPTYLDVKLLSHTSLSNMVLTLYASSRASGGGGVVALVLAEKEIPFKLVAVDLAAKEQKTPEFLAMHPFGQVPVIVSFAFQVHFSVVTMTDHVGAGRRRLHPA